MIESFLFLSIILLFVGLLGGFLSGLLGIGGGIIYVFTLTYVYKELFDVGEEIIPATTVQSQRVITQFV